MKDEKPDNISEYHIFIYEVIVTVDPGYSELGHSAEI